jgi:peptidoglycan DL-endopeptidase CwlO
MIRVHRWGTIRSIPVLVLAGTMLVTVLAPLSSAQAGTITDAISQIKALSATLSRQSQISESSANAYGGAQEKLQQIKWNIASLNKQVAQKKAAIIVTEHAMASAIVNAYVYGAATAQIMSLFNQDVTTSDARKVFQDQVIGNLDQIKATYESQKKALNSAIKQVTIQEAAAQEQTNRMKALMQQNIANENATRVILNGIKGAFKTQIINYEILQGIAAAKAHNYAGQQQAVAVAQSVGGIAAGNAVLTAIAKAVPPTVSQIAGTKEGAAAVAAALSQIGLPYIWGGATPGKGFDCSSLVQWAWGQAGFTIPRTTQTQWPALHHVALSALQPGDLLYYYNLDGDHQVDHVVMYIGSGPYGTSTIFAAAKSGTKIGYQPLFTFGLIGAARP